MHPSQVMLAPGVGRNGSVVVQATQKALSQAQQHANSLEAALQQGEQHLQHEHRYTTHIPHVKQQLPLSSSTTSCQSLQVLIQDAHRRTCMLGMLGELHSPAGVAAERQASVAAQKELARSAAAARQESQRCEQQEATQKREHEDK